MSNQLMTFDQSSAEKSGGSDYLQTGGAYVCKILEAKCIKAKTGSSGVEFSIVTSDGQKANYLTTYYLKADGSTVIPSGKSLLDALMGFLGLQAITFIQKNVNGEMINSIPEFCGRKVGLFLDKVIYSKRDGSGDGYKFDIRFPFDPQTKQTFSEKTKGAEAKVVERMANSYSDKDERESGSNGNQGYPQQQPAQQQRGPSVPDDGWGDFE